MAFLKYRSAEGYFGIPIDKKSTTSSKGHVDTRTHSVAMDGSVAIVTALRSQIVQQSGRTRLLSIVSASNWGFIGGLMF